MESTGVVSEDKIKDILRRNGFSVYVWEDPPGTYYPTHTHPNREIRWVVKGEVVMGTEGKEIVLKEGDVIELDPETPHWAKTEKGVRYICGSK